MPDFFFTRREEKKQKYYDEYSPSVYATILRYQTNANAAAGLLEQLFTDVLSMRRYKNLSKEKLYAMAVQRSLLEVLQPADTLITYDYENDESAYDALQEADVNSLRDDELQEIVVSLPLHERVFYNALVIDKIPKKDIALWTGSPEETIGKIVANAKFLIAKGVVEKIRAKS